MNSGAAAQREGIMNNIDQLVANNSAFSSFEDLLNAPDYRPSCDMSNPAMRVIADAYDKAQEERGDERRAYRFGEAKVEAKAKVETEFVVMSASTKCPAKFGIYKKVAILEVRKGWLVDGKPERIDTRALGVVRIAWERDRLNYGSTSACAFDRALAEAHELAARWNAEAAEQI